MGQAWAVLCPFNSLFPWAVVRFGAVIGLRARESRCFLLSVSDYVPTYVGRSACFILKRFRLNSKRKQLELLFIPTSPSFHLWFGPTNTLNDSCLLPICYRFLWISILYNSGRVWGLRAKAEYWYLLLWTPSVLQIWHHFPHLNDW